MSKINNEWTIPNLLNWTETYLKKQGFKNARLESEQLLAHTLNLNRIELYLNYDIPLKKTDLSTFKSHVKRRLNHEPIRYIIGNTEFMSLTFNTDTRSIIPRPETEQLVEYIIEKSKKNFGDLMTNIFLITFHPDTNWVHETVP